MTSPAALRLTNIQKEYGGLRAVGGVSVTAGKGEILGIVGPNGAGKTTLFDVITGLTAATAGEVELAGKSLNGRSVHARCRHGMSRTFQRPTAAGQLTVRENVAVAAHFGNAWDHWSGISSSKAEFVEWCIGWARLDEVAADHAELLSVYDKKRLMLATAMAMGPLVLLLDEPFGGLNDDEIDVTLSLITKAAAMGVTVVCIEHVMRALVKLATRVLVMDHGQPIFEGSPTAMLADERVIEVYLGRSSDKDLEGLR